MLPHPRFQSRIVEPMTVQALSLSPAYLPPRSMRGVRGGFIQIGYRPSALGYWLSAIGYRRRP